MQFDYHLRLHVVFSGKAEYPPGVNQIQTMTNKLKGEGT